MQREEEEDLAVFLGKAGSFLPLRNGCLQRIKWTRTYSGKIVMRENEV
jgi:hypothetical protein